MSDKKAYYKQWAKDNQAKKQDAQKAWKHRDPLRYMLFYSKRGAVKRGMPFALVAADFPDLPTHCPVFGIELEYAAEGPRHDGTASIDRVDNSMGCTPSNVRIISWRANRLKSDATAEDLRRLLNYLEGKA
jgi:hypothetical protein